LQLNGLIDGMRDLEWDAGDEFTLVSVSIDPSETADAAKRTKDRYLRDYGRAGVGKGFRFLTGSEANIKRLADAVGFKYKFVPETGDFSHAAALMVCTPGGKISRYLYGVEYDAQTLRLSLVEAGEGKVGSAMDQLILYCFHYDETKGRYGPVAKQIMKVGAGATVLVLSVVLVPVWFRSRRAVVQPEPQSHVADRESPTNP
jgi:protein SCO1/2